MPSYVHYSSRIANASRSWQAICETNVENWVKTNEFIIAMLAQTDAHSGDSSQFKLQWGIGESPTEWTDLGASGAMKYGSNTDLVDGTTPIGGGDESTCASLTDSDENEGDGTTTLMETTAKDQIVEMQFAVDPSDASGATTYSFRLYDITAGAALGVAGASLVTATEAQSLSQNVSDTVTLGDSQKKGFAKQLSETITFADLQPKSVGKAVSDALAIAESKIKSFLKSLAESLNIASSTSQTLGGGGAALSETVTDFLTFVDSQRKNLGKTVSDVLSLAPSKIKALTKTVSDSLNIGSAEQLSLSKILSEALSFVTSKIKGLTKSVSDALDISDSSQSLFSKILSDLLSLGSSTSQSLGAGGLGLSATVSDTITFVDNQIKNVAKTLGEFITIISFNASSFIKNLLDSLTIATSTSAVVPRPMKLVLSLLQRKLKLTLKRP